MREPPPNLDYPEELFPLQALTGTIIASAFTVFNTLGFGFLESVYRRALVIELRHRGVFVEEDKVFDVMYRGQQVGKYKGDVVAERRVIVETKTGRARDPTAPPQLLNYLSAAKLDVGLILHFGPRGVHVKRMAATEERRPIEDE
jgi:GxxExxY protein